MTEPVGDATEKGADHVPGAEEKVLPDAGKNPDTEGVHDSVDPEQEESTDPETFPREYVEQLRQESGRYRQRAQRADDLAQRLHLALVTATGKLADPTDLPFDESHLDDAGALSAAIDDLLGRKPHLATRRPSGDVGQGASTTGDTVSLAGILRANAS